MYFIYSNLIIFIFFTLSHSDVILDPISEDTLKSTHGAIIFSAMVFRHGARNPESTFPTNPHTDYLMKSGLGQLTQEGKMQAYQFGQWARARYDHLLQDVPYYTAELFNTLSSGYHRTVSSAQLFLAGFYPPTSADKEIWKKDLLWQPIAVFTIPPEHDRMIRPQEYCAKFNFEVERIKHSPIMKKLQETHKEMFAYIKEHAQIPIPDDDIVQAIKIISDFHETLKIQEYLGLAPPTWAEKVYPTAIKNFLTTYAKYKASVFNHEMKRIKGGPLLGHIIRELKNKRNNLTPEKRFQFYSGHATTLNVLKATLGIHNQKPPEYSSSLLFELRRLDQNYIVTVLYKQSQTAHLTLLEIPNCPSPCTLDDFIQATQSLIPEDWEEECNNLEPDYNKILF